jgi:hypothetical protein
MPMQWLQSLAPLFHSVYMERFVHDYRWTWPICETLHFTGLALLVGVTGVLDLRMLGYAKGIRISHLHKLIPWAILGFILLLGTGILFFSVNTGIYLSSWAFPLKMLFIFLAGVNVLVFYATVFKKVEQLGPDEDAPPAAKAMGAISLFLWVGVIFFGRMLGF